MVYPLALERLCSAVAACPVDQSKTPIKPTAFEQFKVSALTQIYHPTLQPPNAPFVLSSSDFVIDSSFVLRQGSDASGTMNGKCGFKFAMSLRTYLMTRRRPAATEMSRRR